ncbi:MAG: nucleotidyltransferase family protein [Desulfobacteraceae bacterium]|nr:nucleotidyltransferase family protein [Desulfobacteraceae bacterium]
MKLETEKLAGLLLAAGASTRMGQPKQLLRVEGETLLERMLGEVLSSDLDLAALVLGFQAQEIRKSLKTHIKHPKLKIIENRSYLDGISTSIIAGLSEVENFFDHVMIILADMPLINSSLINLFLHQYLASPLQLGAIKLIGRRSHPVIIGRQFYDELRQLKGDVGARDLFLKYADRVCLVEPEEDYDDVDIDTMEEYLEFKRSLDHDSEDSGSNETQ